ncbi:MAG: 2-phosphosulfolactate phosphatase [Candidatus Asgardarchaeia archaeon]
MKYTIYSTSRDDLKNIDVSRKIVIIIDVLRATTSIVTALSSGAPIVIPVESEIEAIKLKRENFSSEGIILAGEKNNKRIPGFDMGNSPYEFSVHRFSAPIILKTTNGTPLVNIFRKAPYVFALSFLNIKATADYIKRILINNNSLEVILAEAGDENKVSPPDHLCSLYFIKYLKSNIYPRTIDITNFLLTSPHGISLIKNGYTHDIIFSSKLDFYNIVAIFNGIGFINVYEQSLEKNNKIS